MRHQTLVVASAIVLLVAVFALTGSTIAISYQQSQTQAALDEVRQQKKRADENFSRAREAVDTYLMQVSENDKLKNVPSLRPLRKDLLALALKYYQQFAQERADDPELRTELAAAYHRIATITRDAFHAQEPSKHALRLRKLIVEENPTNENAKRDLAESYLLSSQVRANNGAKWDEYIDLADKAVDIAGTLTEPSHPEILGDAYSNLADFHLQRFQNKGGTEHLEQSHEAAQNAIRIFEKRLANQPEGDPRLKLAWAYETVAFVLREQEIKFTEWFKKSLAIAEELHEEEPHNVEYLHRLAGANAHLGNHEKTLEIFTQLANENPIDRDSYLQRVSSVHTSIASKRSKAGQHEAAVVSARASLEIVRGIRERHPKWRGWTSRLGGEHQILGSYLLQAGRMEDAAKEYESAITILTETGKAKGRLSDAYSGLSSVQEAQGNLGGAIVSKQRSAAVGRELVRDFPEKLHFRLAVAAEYIYLGAILRRYDRMEEATQAFRDGIKLLAEAFPDGRSADGSPEEIRNAQDVLIRLHVNLGNSLAKLNRVAEAEDALQPVIEIVEPLYDNETTKLHALKATSESLWAIGENSAVQPTRAKLEDLFNQHLESGLKLARKAVEKDANDRDAWKTWNQMAFRGYGHGNWHGADDEARRAIRVAPDNPDYLLAMAPLLLLSGEPEEYRQLCRRLLDAADASAEPQRSIDNWIVRLCGLDSSAAGFSDRVLVLAQQGMPDGRAYVVYALGRAYYRAGQYEKAVETLNSALVKNRLSVEPLICLDMAIAHHRWGRKNEARKWFERASRLLKNGHRLSWHELAETVVLRHEAEQLLGEQKDSKEP